MKQKFDLAPAQIMLHSSHTHCGPVLRGGLYDVYPLDGQHSCSRIDEYSTWLEERRSSPQSTEALSNLVAARVSGGQGEATFAVNRRNNLEGDVPELRRADALKGPVDHSVPVLAVHSAENKLMAVVFGYACHNTNLSFYQWCGDYAGFAQYALEDVHPDAVAMFYHRLRRRPESVAAAHAGARSWLRTASGGRCRTCSGRTHDRVPAGTADTNLRWSL